MFSSISKKLYAFVFGVVLIPTLSFAQCSTQDRIDLAKQYTKAEIAELCGDTEVTKESKAKQDGSYFHPYVTIRVGAVQGSTEATQYNYNYNYGTYIPSTQSVDSSGTAVSLVLGLDNESGFDFRAFITSESLTYKLDDGYDTEVSKDITLYGMELGYNFSRYFSIFIGIGADADRENLDFQSAGISGRFTESFGYYLMLQETLYRIDEDNIAINEDKNLQEYIIGLTYTF